MWRTLGFAVMAAALIGFAPEAVEAQKKKAADVPNDDVASDKDYKNLKDTKDMSGLVGSIGTNTMMFRLDIPNMQPNPNYKPPKNSNNYNQMQNLYRQQAKIMANPNPIQRQMQMQQLQMQMQRLQQQPNNAKPNPNNQPFTTVHKYKDYDFELSEKLVVRKMFLETEYDDKGNIKTYTKEEMAELKGKDSTKPGYKAKLDDLQPNQKIKIHLAMPKKAKPAADEKAADAKDPEVKAAAKQEEAVVKPLVSMIVILEQAPVVDRANKNAKKKKN